MKIFITGSTGFIGSHFLTELIKKYGDSAKIYCLVRNMPETKLESIEYIQGTLEQIEDHSDILVKCDYVFHIGANAVYSSRSDYDAVNLKPTQKIVDILKLSRVKNFVFLSTIGAVDRENSDRCSEPLNVQSKPSPRSSYGVSKLNAEKYIRSSGIPFTIIRPTWVYGAGMRAKSHIQAFVTMVAKGSRVYKLNFPGRVSLIHVSELIESMMNAIGNEKIIGKTYFAETESRSIGEIFKIIASKVLDKKFHRFSSRLSVS